MKSTKDKMLVCLDPEKITAVQSMSTPKDKKGVREFLGLLKQLDA